MPHHPSVHQGDCEICGGPCSFGSRVGDLLVCASCKRIGPQETCLNGCGEAMWHVGCCNLECWDEHDANRQVPPHTQDLTAR
jgi:hypothetical protein